MKAKTYKISELNTAKYNPRKVMESKSKEYESLKKSLDKFGQVTPIIVNERNNTVIGGHQRLNVLKELGYKDVETIIVDLDEKQEKQLNIALNKTEGKWDYQKLNELLDSMTDKELEFLGFADEELGLEMPDKVQPKKIEKEQGFDFYISSSDKNKVNQWLEANGIEKRIKENETSIVIHMEEQEC